MTVHRHAAALALAGLLALPGPAAAQQPLQRQVDSLAAEVRALRAQLDSLHAALARAAATPAALRAAAAAAAGTDTARLKADTAKPARFVGRERSQPQLNPEISVTGDV